MQHLFAGIEGIFAGEFEEAVKPQKGRAACAGFSSCGQFLAPAVLPLGAANPGCIAGVVDGLDDHTKDRESLAFDVVRLDGRDRRANQPVYILHRLVFRFDDAHFTFTIAPAVVIVAALVERRFQKPDASAGVEPGKAARDGRVAPVRSVLSVILCLTSTDGRGTCFATAST
jgi:hypothetical protein